MRISGVCFRKTITMSSPFIAAASPLVFECYLSPSARERSDPVKLALVVEYDEQLTARLKSLDWESHDARYNREYRSRSRHKGAWTIDTETIATVRERTRFASQIPLSVQSIPLPFGSDRRIEISQCNTWRSSATISLS